MGTSRLAQVHLDRAPQVLAPPPEVQREFERLVRDHAPALQAFALRLTASPWDAGDLVQDCLERALRRFGSFTPESNARAWFFRILHNAFIDRCRARTSAGSSEPLDDVNVEAPEPSVPPAWTSVTEAQLAAAIAALGDDFQIVYRMHAVESLSYKEISLRLGIPLNTVGTRISRARAQLRLLLETSMHEEGGSA